ncbi:MAG: hypothetical protein KGM15_11455 [Pseudomonadota bacterium]|nr:hypothetical protein [Pseudomonadota bacterium]
MLRFPIAQRAGFRVAALMAAALGASAGAPVLADEPPAYVVNVSDVTAKVGEPAVMRVTLKIRDGFRILKAYNNRVGSLSSWDEGVAFENKVVRATAEDDTLVFTVGLRATKPGRHAINGLFRVGYIHDPDEMSMVSLPLIANVTGAE